LPFPWRAAAVTATSASPAAGSGGRRMGGLGDGGRGKRCREGAGPAAMVGATTWATRVLLRLDVQVAQSSGDLDDIARSSYCACGHYRTRCPRCAR